MSELTSNGGTRVYQNSISFRRNLKKHLARHALTPRTDFPTLPLPNPPTPLNYPSHQFPLSPTRSRLPKYPILSGVAQWPATGMFPSCPPCTAPILWDTLFIVGATSRSIQLSFIGCNGRKNFFSTFRARFTPSVRVPIGYRGHFSSPLSYNILP